MSDVSTDMNMSQEHQLYKGLDDYFQKVQAMDAPASVRSDLTMMVMELDCALQAHEAGERPTAMDHFKTVQKYAIELSKSAGTPNQMHEVRSIVESLMTGSHPSHETSGKEMQPWSFTLGAVAADFRADIDQRTANMSLVDAPLTNAARPRDRAVTFESISLGNNDARLPVAPTEDERLKMQSYFKGMAEQAARQDAATARPAAAPSAKASQPIRPATQAEQRRLSSYFKEHAEKQQLIDNADMTWTRPEYKQLATALLPLLDRVKPREERKDALVAMICLQIVNNKEKEYIANGKVKVPGVDTAGDIKEFRQRLDKYVGKLLKSDGLTTREKGYIDISHKPAAEYAKRVQKMIGGGSMLQRMFHMAASLTSAIKTAFGPSANKPANKAVPQLPKPSGP